MNEIPCLAEAFAQVLKEAREEARISQQELAARVSCARSFISFLETRNHLPSLNGFLVICEALGVGPSELLQRLERRLAFLQQGSAEEPEAQGDAAPGFRLS